MAFCSMLIRPSFASSRKVIFCAVKFAPSASESLQLIVFFLAGAGQLGDKKGG